MLVLTLPSSAVHVTIVSPTGKVTGASLVTVTEPQLSLAVGEPRLTPVTEFEPTGAVTTTLPGQAMSGTVVSATMNCAVQLVKLPEPSVAVSVTVFVPKPTGVPESGLC